MRKYLGLAAIISLAASGSVQGASEGTWEYAGEFGHTNWGGLCESGKMQSPIDLAESNVIAQIPVSVDWQMSPLTMFNNGKTIQANFETGSTLTTSGEQFNLVQVHFHTPSEHMISGEAYPLVAHFVHAKQDGELAVLGVMFEEGQPNAEIQKLIDNAGSIGANATAVAGQTFNPNALLPEQLAVYRYMGSLTTPPCSEGVNWHVVMDTVEVSGSQLAEMEKFMGNNARPVQPVNSRLVVAPE